MKPDWDKLAEESHSSVFIADVNCSNEDKLCQDNGVNVRIIRTTFEKSLKVPG